MIKLKPLVNLTSEDSKRVSEILKILNEILEETKQLQAAQQEADAIGSLDKDECLRYAYRLARLKLLRSESKQLIKEAKSLFREKK
jgi:hypothetical protein